MLSTRLPMFPLLLALALIGSASPSRQAEAAPEPSAAKVIVTLSGEPSPTRYYSRLWGEAGIASFRSAPFPDDSRRDGYSSKSGTFPYAGHYDDPTVAIAIPKGYRPGVTVDFIVHFHGWMGNAPAALENYALGEQLEASGRNCILLIPQGPKMAKDSTIGKLQKPGGLKAFVEEAVEVLSRDGRLTSGTGVGRVILSGHSGGYLAIGQGLAVGDMASSVPEVWLFDSSYGQLESIAAHCGESSSSRRLRSIFTDHLMPENVRLMSLLSLKGRSFATFVEDDLCTAGTSAETFAGQPIHSAEARAGEEELDGLLRREPVLFLHTRLTHNRVIDERRYFERFARESPNLEARAGETP